MEFDEVITFEGGINTDDTPQGVPKGDYRDFSYCRLGYNSGNAYAVETSEGTIEINNSQIGLQDQILGATPWQKENAIVYFVFKADLNHQIWVYYINTQTHQVVLTSSELNFDREWPIYHANVIDDICKWTDGRWDPLMYEADGTRLFNPPYQINLRKALDNYYTTVDLQTIDAIKWPLKPPIVSYFTDINRNDNKLRGKLFKFIIQPIYENGEVGVWSMYSKLDLPEQSELIPGTNWVYLNNDNGIRIQFNTGPKIIRKFNIAVQQFDKSNFGTEPPFSVFLQLDKDQDSIADNTIYTTNFYGGVSTAPAMDVFKNYDRLPIVADCQEYLPTNELTYVNFREGYDKPKEEPFILDVGIEYKLNEIQWNAWAALDFAIDYNIGTNASTITSDTNDWDAFGAYAIFPFSAGIIFYGPTPSSASFRQMTYQLTQYDIDLALASGPNIWNWNVAIMQIIGDAFMDQLGYANGTAAIFGLAVRYTFTAGPNVAGVPNPRVRTTRQTLAQPSLKAGATHEFGIVYGDRAYRDSTVYTVDSMNLFVPWFYDIDRSGLDNPDNPFTINADFTINHVPPVWATKYWIVAKPATEILSFGQYTTNANDISANLSSGYVSSITLDDDNINRYKINIDRYYESQNIGAKIQHEIKVGDKIRFIRRRLDAPGTDASQVAYLPYLELDVVDYEPASGEGERQVVYTNIFDIGLIESPAGLAAVLNHLFGQLIEIYTPRPSVDDTGSIFVSTWKDVTEAIDIINPHTEDRSHASPVAYYVQVNQGPGGDFYLPGDQSDLLTTAWNVTIYNLDGTTTETSTIVTALKYNTLKNITELVLQGITLNPNMAFLTFDYIDQVVDNLASTTPATFTLSYGDVYVRQRNYQTGMAAGSTQAYYFIEDPNYSDYWASNIHETGRTRIEDQNAKMTHRQATAIHSGTFILGTQVNNLSSFALDNENIKDMNPTFGPVIRAVMSGREGKTLKCLQPKKENSIYIQYYPNEVGSDSTVRVSNATFASWFDYKSLFGCSNPGATALLPNGSTMYFDNNAGVFIYSGANGQIVVSEIDQGTGKDYKFRTKTKALAAAYNSSASPVVRTYINESVGEVGFAFRFQSPYSGEAVGIYNPIAGQFFQAFLLWEGNFEYLYGYSMVFYFNGTGNVYSGVVNFVQYNPLSNSTYVGLDGVTPDVDDYLQPGYYFTTNKLSYDHVVFDYVNMRWRSTYDYNFQQFCNLGQTLVGWGINNQLYLHNQSEQWTFHGDSFIQKVSFVSNEQPLRIKRYQDIALVSDDLFSITAESEPNRSYPRGMKTKMPKEIINTYEGYGKVYYRKNLYDPRFFTGGGTSTSAYDPPTQPVNGWFLASNQTFLLGQNITILQSNGENFSGSVATAVYDSLNDQTLITLFDSFPGTNGIPGTWYGSDKAYLNGEDIRANALTHTLEYDPTINNTGSVLVAVGIKGVLS